MTKILFITYYWPPAGGAGVQRALKFAKHLPESGFHPVILTVDSDEASYPILDESLVSEVSPELNVHRTSSFEILKVLQRITPNEKIPHGGFANKSEETFFQRVQKFIRGNFFIPDARKGWVKFAFEEAVRIIQAENIQKLIISSPPHSSQLIGLKLKKKFPDLKWIADLRDPWTDIYYYKEMMHSAPARAIDRKYERQVLEGCDAALVVSHDIKRIFASKSARIDANKIHVIPNGFDESDFTFASQPPSDHFLITYVGTLADTYKPEIFFRELKKVMEANLDVSFRIRFVGSASPLLRKMLQDYSLTAITEFIPHVSHGEAIRYMRESTALLLVIPEVEHDKGILTGKLFEYLGAGKPVIAVGPPDGEASAILNECKSGRMFGRNDEAGLGQHLTGLLTKWKTNSNLDIREPGISAYTRKSQATVLADIIREL